MTEEEMQDHAQRILEWHVEDVEYCLVYEDEELEDASEDEWQRIHYLITHATVSVRG